ncbi:hypothetical protein OU798_10275 [Prolixibacteraceae bacterium Z1-6]|uniref:Uncharacterized protein n=1 Tax=Draconibacterium aestuarii TaxID=2998507 RepID=A0A9X3F8G9_9BACT|nr:hypothetical protein [Prolixibacteraceae bacterium Z1-6]
MRTTVVFIFLLCLGLSSLSQNRFSIKPMPHLEFKDFGHEKERNLFLPAPNFTQDTIFQSPLMLPGEKDSYLDLPDSNSGCKK